MGTHAGSTDEDPLVLTAQELTRGVVNGARVGFGILGLAAVVIGVGLLVWPERVLSVAAVLIAIYLLVDGLVRLVFGIVGRGVAVGYRILDLALALLFLFAGVIALRNIQATGATLLVIAVLVLGFGLIVDGILAFAESGSSAARGWSIALGVVSLLAGIAVLVYPGWTAALLMVFGGIALVIVGILGIVRAFTFGRDELRAAKSAPEKPVVEGRVTE